MGVRGPVAALGAVAVLVCAGSSGAAGRAQTYTDATGDQQGAAPDITRVSVADTTQGQLTFQIDIANQTTLASDSQVVLWLDTDRNGATGAPNSLGSNYVFVVAATGYEFGRWTGTGFDPQTPYSTVRVSNSNGVTISINRSELGNTTGFNFWVRGLQNTGTPPGNVDDAPNDGTYAYQIVSSGPPYGVVGRRSMAKLGNGARATFTFSALPAPGARVAVVWIVNGKRLAQVGRTRATTVSSSVLGVRSGTFEAQLRVRPPGRAWKTVAKVRRRL